MTGWLERLTKIKPKSKLFSSFTIDILDLQTYQVSQLISSHIRFLRPKHSLIGVCSNCLMTHSTIKIKVSDVTSFNCPLFGQVYIGTVIPCWWNIFIYTHNIKTHWYSVTSKYHISILSDFFKILKRLQKIH